MLRTTLGAAICCAFVPLAASPQPPQGRAAPVGIGYHGIDLPTATPAGQDKETRTLFESPHLKLASIILRRGTVLAEHSAPVAVTIQALSGSGVVEIGDKREKVSPGRMVYLAPNTKHAVRPDGTAELVLLVHHLSARPGPPSTP